MDALDAEVCNIFAMMIAKAAQDNPVLYLASNFSFRKGPVGSGRMNMEIAIVSLATYAAGLRRGC